MFKIWLLLIVLSGLQILIHSQYLWSENENNIPSIQTNVEELLLSQDFKSILNKDKSSDYEFDYATPFAIQKEEVQNRFTRP